MGVKLIVYDYSKEPPAILTIDSPEFTTLFNSLPNHKELEIAIQEPTFEPINIGKYFILRTDVVTPPEPPVPPVEGNILYDSNTIGKWNDGTVLKITTFDPRFVQPFKNGKGLEMHASGNPRLFLDGKGVGRLEADSGHGRVYIDSVNYKAITEYELCFDDTNIDNHTCQTQSRHQEGDPTTNRFGGISHMLSAKDKTVGTKLERFHNEHISGPEVSLPKALEIGKFYKVRYTDIPDQAAKTISTKIEVDFGSGYEKVLEHKFTGLEAYMVDEATFQKISYTWFRVNNIKTGSISLKNIKQTKIV